MRLAVAVVVLAGMCLVWGGSVDAQTRPNESVVGKVAVTARGTVSFDGARVTIDVL